MKNRCSGTANIKTIEKSLAKMQSSLRILYKITKLFLRKLVLVLKLNENGTCKVYQTKTITVQ